MSPEPRDPERRVVELREQRHSVVVTGPADITPPEEITATTRTVYRYTIDDGVTSSTSYFNPKQEPDRKDRRRAFRKFINGNRRY